MTKKFKACGVAHSTSEHDSVCYWVAEISQGTYERIKQLQPLHLQHDLAQIRVYAWGVCEWYEQLPGKEEDYDWTEVYEDEDWTGEDQECARAECEHLIISDDSIWFEASDKYTSNQWSSNMVPLTALEEFFDGVPATPNTGGPV